MTWDEVDAIALSLQPDVPNDSDKEECCLLPAIGAPPQFLRQVVFY